jgi:hypothetical protein
MNYLVTNIHIVPNAILVIIEILFEASIKILVCDAA